MNQILRITVIFSGLILGSFVGCSEVNNIPTQPTSPGPFSNELEVTIKNYNSDAMEPFISGDNQYLFFNSLNSKADVKIYYATRVTDTEFNFQGEVNGVNSGGDNLDGVPSLDASNHFYWVTNLNYPTTYFLGDFSSGTVTNISAQGGDFYINRLGSTPAEYWTIMDAEISRSGNQLYYVNAEYDSTWKSLLNTSIGVANKNGSSFLKDANTAILFANINNPSYLVYAPAVSSNGLEVFYTRILKTTGTNTEICRSVRSNLTEAFGEPSVVVMSGLMPEAPTLSQDGQRLYYHKNKSSDGLYHIYMQSRN